jgi:hypothetical protein
MIYHNAYSMFITLLLLHILSHYKISMKPQCFVTVIQNVCQRYFWMFSCKNDMPILPVESHANLYINKPGFKLVADQCQYGILQLGQSPLTYNLLKPKVISLALCHQYRARPGSALSCRVIRLYILYCW